MGGELWEMSQSKSKLDTALFALLIDALAI